MSVIVARSTGGGSSASSSSPGSVTSFQGNVALTNTEVVDTVTTDSVVGAKWLVTITTPDYRACGYEIFAVVRPNDTVSFTVYAMLGDTILHGVDVTILGGILNLQISNSDTVPLTVRGTRIEVTR